MPFGRCRGVLPEIGDIAHGPLKGETGRPVLAATLGYSPFAWLIPILRSMVGKVTGWVELSRDFGGGADTPYILGMAKVKGKVKILLEIDQVLIGQDMSGLDALIQQVER